MKAYALSLLMLAACQSEEFTASDAITVANTWYAKQFRSAPDERLTVRTADIGDQWRVIYAIPPDWAGGNTIVFVDKSSRKVVRYQFDQ